jgi:hypothetical protein
MVHKISDYRIYRHVSFTDKDIAERVRKFYVFEGYDVTKVRRFYGGRDGDRWAVTVRKM